MNYSISIAQTGVQNYESKLPAKAGMLAGLAGSLSIMLVVTGILLVSGSNLGMAAHMIATSVYGPDAGAGFNMIMVGTVLHLTTGTVLGAFFAWAMPRVPRGVFIFAGLVYGILAWLATTFIVLPVIAPLLVATDVNIGVLLIAHVVYGFTLGLAGAGYGLWWHLPKSSPEPR